MHENDIKAIYHILDIIIDDDFLRCFIEHRLQRKELKSSNIGDLLATFTKIVNQVVAFNGREFDLLIIQDLRVEIMKDFRKNLKEVT